MIEHNVWKLGDQRMKSRIIHIGGCTIPSDNQAQFVQHETQFTADNPTMICLSCRSELRSVLRGVGKQVQMILGKPAIECSLAYPFEGKHESECHDFAGVEFSLHVFWDVAHRIIYAAKQFAENLESTWGLLLVEGLVTINISQPCVTCQLAPLVINHADVCPTDEIKTSSRVGAIQSIERTCTPCSVSNVRMTSLCFSALGTTA